MSAGFYLTDIVDVDEGDQTFEFEGVLTLRWLDERLAFDPAVVGVDEKIYQGDYQFSEVATGWWPQLILANESGRYDTQGIVLRVRPDGSTTYIEEIAAVAESPMALRAFPFDSQRLEAVFEVLGFNAEEVLLAPDPETTGGEEHGISVAQWDLRHIVAVGREYDPLYADGRRGSTSALAIEIDVKRHPGYLLRVVVVPLMLLVMLSWSVFWMSRESLGERMDISFIGILTVVAFQIMVSDRLPEIPYFTLMSTFLYVNYIVLWSSVVVNLVVGAVDQRGNVALGDRIDRTSRWLFPVAYAGLIALSIAYYELVH